jgi:uncharacterized coiled-coil protein SlyX
MQEQLKKRVAELEAEHSAGQQMLAELDAKRADLQHTLLRISGAIQVLKEILAAEGYTKDDGAAPTQRSTLPSHQNAELPSLSAS